MLILSSPHFYYKKKENNFIYYISKYNFNANYMHNSSYTIRNNICITLFLNCARPYFIFQKISL